MNWISNLLMKYLGPKFLGRAASTVVVALSALIGKYLPGLDPALLARWSQDTIEIVSLVFGLLLGLLLDKGLSKPDQPEMVK